MDHFAEQFNGRHSHEHAVSGVLHTLGVFVDTENTDLAVLARVSLEAFKTFLAVMQASSGHVDANVLGRRKFYLAPLTIAVVATDIVIGIVITEGERLPIDSVQIKHNLTFFAVCAFLKVSFGTAQKNTIIAGILASLVQKFCKKIAPYYKGGSLPLIAAPPSCHPERSAAGTQSKDLGRVFHYPLERGHPATPRTYSESWTQRTENP